MKRALHALAAGSLVLAIAGQASAADLSFAGTLAQDDTVRLFDFSTSASGLVTIETFSYAGGINATGAVVPNGGFDPIISLFTSTGTLIAGTDDGATRIDPNGNASDSLLSLTLGAGSYVVAISQYGMFPQGSDLASGWTGGGAAFTSVFGCSNGMFCDASGNNRTSAFNLSITGVSLVPEPPVYALMLGALAVLGAMRRRTK